MMTKMIIMTMTTIKVEKDDDKSAKNRDKKLTMTKTMRMMTTINNCNDEINDGDNTTRE